MSPHNGGAQLLADAIQDILNHGAGPKNISYDDIRIVLKTTGLSLDDAKSFLLRHLDTALDKLMERGWNSVKTTTAWDAFDHKFPDDERAVKQCIAGIGRAGRAVGLHFTVDEDDWLFLWARDHGARVWRGKRAKEVERLVVEHEAGRLTPTGLAIAELGAAATYDKPYSQAMRGLKQ